MSEPTENAVPAAVRTDDPRKRWALSAALLVLALALAWNWYDTRRQLGSLRAETAKRLQRAQEESREARVLSANVQESLRQLQAQTGGIEVKLLESRSQQEALESLYHELSRNRDDWLLAEAEQTLNIASQQLQLAGNVQAALSALQTVDLRLARPDRPQFLSLRKVLARDIEKLRAAPNLDVSGMTLRLDQALNRVDALPLAVDAHAHAEPQTPPAAPEASWWRRTLHSVWGELKQLVRVERLDARTPDLLAPEQRYFLRENLKLRLLHARVALLQRDALAFRNDLGAVLGWLKLYFDVQDPEVAATIDTLGDLSGVAVDVQLPNISESLNAVRNFSVVREKAR